MNLELAQIFYQIADLLEMKEAGFKSRAYEKAARVLESMEKDAGEIYREKGIGGLKEIPGVGEGIARKMEEYVKTGKIRDFQRLKKECPVNLDELLAVEGLAAKKIKVLYRKLKIKNLDNLEKAAKFGKIRKLEGFGEKSETNILQAIAFARRSKGRFLLGEILPAVRKIISRLDALPEVGRIEVAGSVRRMQETVGDIDILVTSSRPEKVMDYFTGMDEVVKVWAKGLTKSSARLKGGYDCDLRVIKKESFGAALQYFTGNKYHNILTRRLAMKKGLKLNEYGVFHGGKKIAGKTEEEVYQTIGLSYIEPEIRNNTGEIEAALWQVRVPRQSRGKINGLPKLVGYNDIKGDCHCHSDWSDGVNTIEEIAKAAKKMGYQYIVITDHAGSLKIARALGEKELLNQMREIDKLNQRLSGMRILKGCEVNIKKDGLLDIKDEILEKLDVVVASVHSAFKMNKEDMTKRIVRAIENPNVDIIGHPTGRVIFQREGYPLDLEEVLKFAKKTKTALEINAYFSRLDLKDIDIRKTIDAGVKLTIGTDAHSISHLSFMELGIAAARRGWAGRGDILNACSLEKFLRSFKE